MKIKQIQPASFIPQSPSDFAGPAHDIALVFEAKANAVREQRNGNLKYVLTGEPGIGKTSLGEYLAGQLTGEKITKGQSFHVESVKGRNVDMVLIRRWQSESRYVPTTWTVRIVNELDTCGQDKQDLLLTYLDELGDRIAFIGTSNRKLKDMDEAFQSRLQAWAVPAPQPEDIHAMLKRFGVKKQIIPQLVLGCGGNIRAALLDAQSILDAELV